MVIIIYIALITIYLMYRAWHLRRDTLVTDTRTRLFLDDRHVRIFVCTGLILLVPALIVVTVMPKQSWIKTCLLIPCYPGLALTKYMLGKPGGSYINVGSIFAILVIFLVNHILTFALAGKIFGYFVSQRRRPGGSPAKIPGRP